MMRYYGMTWGDVLHPSLSWLRLGKLTCSSCVSGMLCDQLPSVMDAAICQNIVAKTDCDHCTDCQKFVICAGHDCDSDYINQCEDS